jgi:hypothetical protein
MIDPPSLSTDYVASVEVSGPEMSEALLLFVQLTVVDDLLCLSSSVLICRVKLDDFLFCVSMKDNYLTIDLLDQESFSRELGHIVVPPFCLCRLRLFLID